MCVCASETGVCACVPVRERESVCTGVRESACMRVRRCVLVRERERERVREREFVDMGKVSASEGESPSACEELCVRVCTYVRECVCV